MGKSRRIALDTEERIFHDELLADACQINVFQVVKQYTTKGQRDQFSNSNTGEADWTKYTDVTNSATHFVALRMKEAKTLVYSLQTDVNGILVDELPICVRLPAHLLDEIYSPESSALRGSDVIKAIRQHEQDTRTPPVAIISCTGNTQDKSFLLECGADSVWEKPMPDFRDGSMQQALSEVLRKRDATRSKV